MYDTRNSDAVAAALLELTGCLNSPRQDDVLLNAAGVSLDRALFPLLVRIGAAGTIGVARLADLAGRDASTISRQLARLEQLGLIDRPPAPEDLRLREAALTPEGARIVAAITETRRRALNLLMQDWSETERELFPVLLQRLTDAVKAHTALKQP